MSALGLLARAEADEQFGSWGFSVDEPKVNKPLTPPSSGEVSPVWNAVAFRRSFPEQWGQYLRDKYRTAYAVERAFGIDSKTARDWINGKRDPSGSFVIAECARDQSALQVLGRIA